MKEMTDEMLKHLAVLLPKIGAGLVMVVLFALAGRLAERMIRSN